MIVKAFFYILSLSPTVEEKFWKWWYQRLAASYRKKDWRFMNYGYVPVGNAPKLLLKPEDELDRLFIQLYNHVLEGIDLKGKTLLEVGSGRGGGADFAARYFSPASVTGIDLSKNAVELSRQFFQAPQLHFVEGSAEKLPFPDNQFDVVFNVESSHCYGNMQAFVDEVERVLKPGGIFAWADLRLKEEMVKVVRTFDNSPLHLISKEEITPNVIEALTQISAFKEKEIKEKVPFLWRHFFSEFAGVKHSKIYKAFLRGDFVYWTYRFKKKDGNFY